MARMALMPRKATCPAYSKAPGRTAFFLLYNGLCSTHANIFTCGANSFTCKRSQIANSFARIIRMYRLPWMCFTIYGFTYARPVAHAHNEYVNGCPRGLCSLRNGQGAFGVDHFHQVVCLPMATWVRVDTHHCKDDVSNVLESYNPWKVGVCWHLLRHATVDTNLMLMSGPCIVMFRKETSHLLCKLYLIPSLYEFNLFMTPLGRLKSCADITTNFPETKRRTVVADLMPDYRETVFKRQRGLAHIGVYCHR